MDEIVPRNSRIRAVLAVALVRWAAIAAMPLGWMPSPSVRAAEAINCLTGRAFSEALGKPLSGTWENASLRTILARVGSAQHVAIVLDGRLDPDAELSVELKNKPTLDLLRELVDVQQGSAVAVGNTIYVGPASACGRLRTLIELRRDELTDAADAPTKVPTRRAFDLNKRTTIQWKDLDTPQQIVRDVASKFALRVEQIELVPHDLWAGATLPQATAVEALSLALQQFDLTFEWLDRANGIRIVKAPERVAVARFHPPPRGLTAAQAAERWREAYPDAKIDVDKTRLRVVATIDEHEELDRASLPTKSLPKSTKSAAGKNDLRLKRFTLTTKAPVSALISAIEKNAGVQFEYDAVALRKADVNLDQPVSVDVKDAPLDRLLDAVFTPLALRYEVVGTTVRLSVPK
jgi:hypothetical protein